MEHKEIKTIKLFEDGSLVLKFEDNSHTYIEPDLMKEISEQYNKLNIK